MPMMPIPTDYPLDSAEQCAALARHLEQLGLVYLRAFARLRQALEANNPMELRQAVQECQPLIEAWSREGWVRRQRDRLWAGAEAVEVIPFSTRQPGQPVITSGELRS